MKVRYDVNNMDMTGVGFWSRDQREAFEMAKKIAAQDRFGEAFMTRNVWNGEGRITEVSTVVVRQDGTFRRI